MIIGISGKKQSGKNLTASIIQALISESKDSTIFRIPKSIENIMDKHDIYSMFETGEIYKIPSSLTIISNWYQKSFAFKLKQIVSILTGYAIFDLDKEEIKSKELGEEWRKWYWTYYKMECKDNPKGRISKNFVSEEEALEYFTYGDFNQSLSVIFPNAVLKSDIPTVRELLQTTGTEFGRDLIHPNIWINALFNEYNPSKVEGGFQRTVKDKNGVFTGMEYEVAYPNWLITDVRFPNEAEAIKQREGLLIRVNRDYVLRGGPEDPNTQHESETALDKYDKFDEIIQNDGSIKDLIDKVKEILIKHKII